MTRELETARNAAQIEREFQQEIRRRQRAVEEANGKHEIWLKQHQSWLEGLSAHVGFHRDNPGRSDPIDHLRRGDGDGTPRA